MPQIYLQQAITVAFNEHVFLSEMFYVNTLEHFYQQGGDDTLFDALTRQARVQASHTEVYEEAIAVAYGIHQQQITDRLVDQIAFNHPDAFSKGLTGGKPSAHIYKGNALAVLSDYNNGVRIVIEGDGTRYRSWKRKVEHNDMTPKLRLCLWRLAATLAEVASND